MLTSFEESPLFVGILVDICGCHDTIANWPLSSSLLNCRRWRHYDLCILFWPSSSPYQIRRMRGDFSCSRLRVCLFIHPLVAVSITSSKSGRGVPIKGGEGFARGN